MHPCPLCTASGNPFHKQKERLFLECSGCGLVFQDKESLPLPDEEKARYELHDNNPADEGYRKWLESFIKAAVLPWHERGPILDYGSGPRPVLSEMLRERGYDCSSYDPFFAPRWPEGGNFTLILLCEVLEHMHDPLRDFKKLADLSSEGAVLVLKTQFLPEGGAEAFSRWWYKEDSTHIRFYRKGSLETLGRMSGWTLLREDGSSLAVFRKSRAPAD